MTQTVELSMSILGCEYNLLSIAETSADDFLIEQNSADAPKTVELPAVLQSLGYLETNCGDLVYSLIGDAGPYALSSDNLRLEFNPSTTEKTGQYRFAVLVKNNYQSLKIDYYYVLSACETIITPSMNAISLELPPVGE
jgi:hypothetical protein